MPEQPLVSIIIPTFNRAYLIGETLDSVLAQTYQNWECIVVDDGSSDHTKDVLAEYCSKDKRFKYYSRPKNRLSGGNAARNYGFELSKGDYIQWFDSDDIMHKDKLAYKIKKVLSDKADCCISKTSAFKSKPGDDVFITNITTDDIFKDYVLKRVSIGTSQPMWKRRFIESQDLFDESIIRGQDYDFHSRLFFQDIKLSFVEKVLTYYRIGDDGITNKFNLNAGRKFTISNYKVYRKAHKLVLNRKDKELYYGSVNIFLGYIKKTLQEKEFGIAMDNLKFLNKNRLNRNIYLKLKHLKLIAICFILKNLNLKGYYILKDFFKI